MSGFPAMFADLLNPAIALSPGQVAKELARYHHYRKHNGMKHDADILAALKGRDFLPGADLHGETLDRYPRSERMVYQLIGSVMECLEGGREIHSAMMCGLTACASREAD